MPAKSIVAVASILAAFQLAAPAHAAGTFTVNTILDTNTPDMVLSLREAILVSNGTISGTFTAQEQAQMSGCTFDGGGFISGGCGDGVRDTIVVPAGTYTVTVAGMTEGTGDFDITEDVTILGAGSATTIVDGNDLDRVFEIGSAADDVAISGLTIRNGQTTGVGGGIYINGGGLTLSSSVVKENTSPNGGGFFNGGGDLTLVGSSVVDNNVGSTSAQGGGIYNEGGGSALDIVSGSVISGNDASLGAGINNGGSVIIRDSQVVGNDAALDGGGINNAGTMSITSSRLTGNTAGRYGGGILNADGVLTLTNSVVQGNNAVDVGGGISNQEATLTITGSSVIGNTGVTGGGGINVANASATIVNTTISGNSTNSVGGGLLVEEFAGTSTATLNNVTIAGNTADADAPTGGGDGGGLSNAGGDVTLRNTVLAGNADRSQAGAVHPDCNGSLISAGHNLVQNATGCTFAAAPGDLVGQQARLGPLTELNGAFVHPLLSDSPAIDTGDPATCSATDQRGVPRPQHAVCDMGAYEHELPFSLTIGNARVKEGDRGKKAMVFLVRLSAPRAQAVSVGFRTQKGTAKPRQDFVGRRGRLTFAPGVTLRRLVIRIRGDLRDERREKFRVVLRNPTVATIADGIGVGTIRDND